MKALLSLQIKLNKEKQMRRSLEEIPRRSKGGAVTGEETIEVLSNGI